jgi:hypothetical protein
MLSALGVALYEIIPGPQLSARRSNGHRYSGPPEAGTVTSDLHYRDLKAVAPAGGTFCLFALWRVANQQPEPHGFL